MSSVDIESFEFWFPIAAKESILEQGQLTLN
ncbi:MAG: hypothetical protein AB8V06_04380 [Francisella endosymbiont of Hyalomma asiaticum]